MTDTAQPGLKRLLWLDVLRVIAGLSVVFVHATTDLRGKPFPDVTELERLGPMLIRAVSYIARTELFLIISILLLVLSLDRRPRGYFETLKDYGQRLLIPFAFWVVFYAFFRLVKAYALGYEDAIWAQLSDPAIWAQYFILGKVQYHMHFLPTLFALMLFFPLFLKAIHMPICGLMIFLCLTAKEHTDVLLWSEFRDWAGFEYLLRLVKVLTYTGYGFVAASFYGLLRRGLTAEQFGAIASIAIMGCVLTFGFKLADTYHVVVDGEWNYGYGPGFWGDFLMPVMVVGLVLGFSQRDWNSWFLKLAPYSFGMYLMHPAIMDLVELGLMDIVLNPTLFVLGKALGALFITLGLCAVMNRVPQLAWMIGTGKIPNLADTSLLRRRSTSKKETP
ncbi:MAG: acyltransferase [Pseudomonadota bacterium]